MFWLLASPAGAFSVAGYRKGFDDARGNVFFKIIKVIEFLKRNRKAPKAILLENVKNFKDIMVVIHMI